MARISLHDRRFMSQAGRTRYFARSATRARSARRGEEKNKALFFSSPRLALRARVALRAKYRVRPAWLIKRLSCRLGSHRHGDVFFPVVFQPCYLGSLGSSPMHFPLLPISWRRYITTVSWKSRIKDHRIKDQARIKTGIRIKDQGSGIKDHRIKGQGSRISSN